MSSDESSNLITEEVELPEENHGDEPTVDETMEIVNEEVNAEITAATGITDSNEENKVKPKRVIRNPQPKLNEKTVMGLRGLGALESYFERVKFKGKGHEENDLNMLMKTYEYWCHRLFPKYPFNSCIARLETLGTKRAVITHIKKIRMGIVNDSEDKLLNTDEEAEIPTNGFINEVKEFDQLLSSDIRNELSTIEPLTEEELERIRLNKERAEKIRKEKLYKIKQMSFDLLPTQIDPQQSDMFAQSSNTNAESQIDPQQSDNMFAQSSNTNAESLSTDLNEEVLDNNTRSNINIVGDRELNQKNDLELRNEHDPCTLSSIVEHQNDVLQNCGIEKTGEQQLIENCNHTKDNCNGGTQNEEHLESNIMSGDGNNELELDQILNIINCSAK